jgi:uncharacterized cupredoxin-like copper-binding protein
MALALVLLGALVSGCAGGSTGMMHNNGSTSTAASGAPGAMMGQGFGSMMGAVPHGYHLSRLTCSAPTSLPGTPVYVMLGDMGMSRMMGGVAPMGAPMMLRAVPTRVAAGTVSFVVGNMGWRTHELVVLPLPQGQSVGQRAVGADGRVEETGSLGEASASCAPGGGDGIKARTVGWVTLTLLPGSYELVCNLPHHYANGMRQEIVVS